MSAASDKWLTPAMLLVPAGFLFGRLYFGVLRHAADALARRRPGLEDLLTLLARLLAAAVFFGFAAREGGLALLMALLGFLVARAVVLRTARRTP